jgi:hypothetical protein
MIDYLVKHNGGLDILTGDKRACSGYSHPTNSLRLLIKFWKYNNEQFTNELYNEYNKGTIRLAPMFLVLWDNEDD